IIDTDPGSDDTYAFYLANASRVLDIKAITSVAGTMTGERTYKNASEINEYLKIGANVARGADGPLCIEQKLGSFLHGENGLGDLVLPAVVKTEQPEKAWDTIYNTAVQCGKITVIAIGPLTNIAIAYLRYPDLPNYVDKIIMMGGSADYGNRTSYAEFNIWADPHAAQIVFGSGMDIYMLGLNVTNKSAIPFEDMARLNGLGGFAGADVEKLFCHYYDYFRQMNIEGIVIHDAVAVAAAIDESLITYKSAWVGAEYTSTINMGRTVTAFDI
ncbi:MAG: nucleoside hydrolase, partial [Oscillospiraceae bacterium]